jgi:hypothetical protein
MRSIKNVKKIFDVEKLVVGSWYILYHSNRFNDGGERRLLSKFLSSDGNYVYDSKCYGYFNRVFYECDDNMSFILEEGKWCVMASNDEVRKYFPEEL